MNIEPHPVRLTRDNAESLVGRYDIVLDGTDNFPTRYLCNDVAVRLQKPNVHGAIHRFEGQISVFAPHLGGPCYRCLFPEPPPPGSVPSCAEGGVLGILPGLVGTLPLVGPLFAGPPLGIGMLTAGIVLAIMVIPFISSVMREVFLTVPTRLKESAYALGSTTTEVVWDIVLPYTRSAVIGGIFLGMGRALGETMAVTFVLGNAHRISASLLEPGNSIAASIANEFAEATTSMYQSALLALGFLLFAVTFIVLAIAKLMLMQLKKREGN